MVVEEKGICSSKEDLESLAVLEQISVSRKSLALSLLVTVERLSWTEQCTKNSQLHRQLKILRSFFMPVEPFQSFGCTGPYCAVYSASINSDILQPF